jgi:hypothetical protein
VQNFCTLHDRLQAAANRLDFGQFRHAIQGLRFKGFDLGASI